jgi:hypothetical protein
METLIWIGILLATGFAVWRLAPPDRGMGAESAPEQSDGND